MTIKEIHKSFTNGQRKQAVEQINKYGLYDFWDDYREYLYQLGWKENNGYFVDAVIGYHRITNR